MCALDNQHLVPIKNTTGHNDHSVNDADSCVSFVHEAGFKVLNVEQQWKVIASPSVQTIRRNIKCWTVNKNISIEGESHPHTQSNIPLSLSILEQKLLTFRLSYPPFYCFKFEKSKQKKRKH